MRSIATHIRTSIVGYVALFLALGAGAYAAGLAPNSVKSKQIKDNQVRTADVRDDSLSGGGLTGDDIVESSLTGVAASGAAGGGLTGNYPNPGIAANAIDSSQVLDDSLTANDLGADSVGTSELGADSVGTSELGADSVGSSELGADSIGTSEIATNGVGKPEIAANTVGSEELLAINEVSNTQPVPYGESLTVVATCPAGQQILTGGFATDPSTAAQMYEVHSRRSAGGWEVRYFNGWGVGVGSVDVTAYAYCLSA